MCLCLFLFLGCHLCTTWCIVSPARRERRKGIVRDLAVTVRLSLTYCELCSVCKLSVIRPYARPVPSTCGVLSIPSPLNQLSVWATLLKLIHSIFFLVLLLLKYICNLLKVKHLSFWLMFFFRKCRYIYNRGRFWGLFLNFYVWRTLQYTLPTYNIYIPRIYCIKMCERFLQIVNLKNTEKVTY